ncbi:DUF4123 domain-containing protein [Oxalobacteraceae bacterium]|nr:DUF4123 domain-containing protein [Oxalobacteraceae bacterium]
MLTITLPDDPIRTGYLLIEPFRLDEESFAGELPMLRCTPNCLLNSDELMPRLIDVAALSPEQQDGLGLVLRRELDGERLPVVCGWLDCPKDAEALARHLIRYLLGPTPDGTQVLWRYYDPRIFSLTMRLFSPDQREALLGPVVAWRFPWCGRWWSVTGKGREADWLDHIEPAWPSAQQWFSLEHGGLVSRMLRKLQDVRDHTDPLTDEDCLRLSQEADVHLVYAKQHLHLSDKDDLMEYAQHCMRYGEAFRRHPKLVSAWPELARGETSWCELISMLDPQDYRFLDKYSELLA